MPVGRSVVLSSPDNFTVSYKINTIIYKKHTFLSTCLPACLPISLPACLPESFYKNDTWRQNNQKRKRNPLLAYLFNNNNIIIYLRCGGEDLMGRGCKILPMIRCFIVRIQRRTNQSWMILENFPYKLLERHKEKWEKRARQATTRQHSERDNRIRANASKKIHTKKVFWVIPVAVCLLLFKEINRFSNNL